jgi:hypothetical protein
VITSLLLNNLKQENKNLMLIQEPAKDFKLPNLERSLLEDAFDEIELLSFPISCTVFELLQTKYRGDIMAKDLAIHHKKQFKMLSYLISRKRVPTIKGNMYFGTWIDYEGTYFDTVHFPFQGGGYYL